jgi:hypothetical protein
MTEQGVKNTDRELWRESDSYYSNSVHVTEQGGIGINVGGHVIVMPLEHWHGLGRLAIHSGKPHQSPKMVAGEMPRYVSHKKVRALQISNVGPAAGNIEAPTRWIEFDGYAPIQAPEAMFSRYTPKRGDYYVVYEDGYASFSPQKAFEEGYTLDEPNALELGAAARAEENRIAGEYKD